MEGITKQFGAVYANMISICLLKKAKSIHFGEMAEKYPDEYSHRAVSAYFRYDLFKGKKVKIDSPKQR